ncbi:aspartate/glutamate racemase family protein [Gordonia sp. zg691]|uniref:aspartate/glutamate racemase family protein n=1 Tax=Gordonia jinghuaiqii TaxID=2758710 RepID=UPI0016624F2A|nr:aspartate/glutamate racemase family protein [Gordonia jinghuaiqii]MBD0861929.1 aspartate/glutamate racemase family protein [Gordonia jinghuaiqii]
MTRRVLVINPNSSESMTEMIATSARNASPGSHIEVLRMTASPEGINTRADEEVAVGAMLDHEVTGRLDDFDAIVVACFGDPGVPELQARTARPVLGIARNTLEYAAATHGGFAIVAASKDAEPIMSDLVVAYGLTDRCRSVTSVGIDAAALARGGTQHRPAITAHIRDLLTTLDNGVESVVLGCTALAPLAQDLETELGIPILDPVNSAVRSIVS